MFHPDMLLSAERLVIAVEAMSQDVKNMSAYVYDISCSVSYLLNERREKDSTSVAACGEGDDPASATSREYEQVDMRPSSYMDVEHKDNFFRDIATMSTDHHENADILFPESNSALPAGIKIEEHFEVNNESRDCDNVYDDSADNVRDHSAFVSRLPQGQMSVAGTSQMESAKCPLMPCMRVHSGERSYKCSACEKSFTHRYKLERHSRVHSGEKPYNCNMCGKAFTQSHHLTYHMRSHSGERPYKCNMCGKAFSQSSHLTFHMRSHTGERPYLCTMCGKAFSLNLTLRDHMRTHTGEKPYRCTLCGMSFGRQYTLNQHMHTHSEEHCN